MYGVQRVDNPKGEMRKCFNAICCVGDTRPKHIILENRIRSGAKLPSYANFSSSPSVLRSGKPALREYLLIIFDTKIIQKFLIGILTVKAGFNKKTLLVIPFL